MAENDQEGASGLLDALGLTEDSLGAALPHDTVYGYYEERGAIFRLYHKDCGCYMQHKVDRIVGRKPVAGYLEEVILRADGDYRGQLVIVCRGPSGGRDLDPEASKATISALYAAKYTIPETTPWHEW